MKCEECVGIVYINVTRNINILICIYLMNYTYNLVCKLSIPVTARSPPRALQYVRAGFQSYLDGETS